jgi:hypothetical protein
MSISNLRLPEIPAIAFFVIQPAEQAELIFIATLLTG